MYTLNLKAVTRGEDPWAIAMQVHAETIFHFFVIRRYIYYDPFVIRSYLYHEHILHRKELLSCLIMTGSC